METNATDSTAVTRDHTTSSTIDEFMRLYGDHLGEENADRPWDQFGGVRYEETSLAGQRKIEVVGGEKLSSSSHRKAVHEGISLSV
ncbi:hypothetical protein RHGRI_014376 [Rhododendron griersonianum]|uniref:Uncharacterized protein n=1 Tax=Rhododendron griersonianum TaxID=479676 RepID=A0AAV6K925_9ERIC|nr:hypothetical protein RHGRI_014376 [Rhododendron griersonianum]